MTNYREILRLKSMGFNNRQISDSSGATRQTVIAVLQRAAACELDYRSAEALSDRELAKLLLQQSDSSKPKFVMPDYDWVNSELARPGVTLQLLWLEYCDKCISSGEIPYQLTQFKKYYREYAVQTKATMHLLRKPGELMEVDWAGQTAAIIDDTTGEVIDAYVFVAVLPYSGYGYVEAFLNQAQPSWIAGHVNAYEYFGGVARILVPDNLKTGVTKHTKSEIILNRSYQEMAEHYGTAIIPTRVRAPKDKATVEGTVGIISTYILAAIRNQKFFTLSELNAEIHERLQKFNHKPFQRKDGSRAALFAEEHQYLLPLPTRAYELSEWKKATVQYNYHVLVDGHYYSVPYEYIKREVDVRLTRNVVEVFCDGSRICSHVRLYDRRNIYSTQDSHMPPNHQEYSQWNGDRFRAWAAKIGVNTVVVVEALFAGYKVEQQGYRTCMSLLKLSEQYTPERLEAACGAALKYTPRPSYIDSFLRTDSDERMKWLIQALLTLITKDQLIKPETVFYLSEIPVTKSELLSLDHYCLSSLLLGIWHFIITNRPDNEAGRATFEALHERADEIGAKWRFKKGFEAKYTKEFDFDLFGATGAAEEAEKYTEETKKDPADEAESEVIEAEVIEDGAGQEGNKTEQTLNNNGRIYHQQAQTIYNIEHIDVFNG